MHYLYVHVKRGVQFKIGEELCEKQRIAIRADYVRLPNGDAVGKVVTAHGLCRKALESIDGVTVFPPAHRPLKKEHRDRFPDLGLVDGDTVYELGEKLHDKHGVEWMHPENWFLGGVCGSADATDIHTPDNPQNPSTPAPDTSTAPM